MQIEIINGKAYRFVNPCKYGMNYLLRDRHCWDCPCFETCKDKVKNEKDCPPAYVPIES